jgi:ankyrin repeat protein
LEQQAQVNVKMTEGRTPLHEAVQSGHLGVVKFLMEQQTEVTVKMTEG